MTPGKTTIATIHSAAPTGSNRSRVPHMYVEVDTIDGVAAGYIDTNGEVMLDAAGLRRLAAACLDAADKLDQLATDTAGSATPISEGTDELDTQLTERRLTIALIEHMKRQGHSQSDIAREYEVTRQAVSWHVRRYGSLTPVQRVFEHFPFQVPARLGQTSPFRLLRFHGEHFATGGVGMNAEKLDRLATFYRRLRGGLVLEFDPELPPEPNVSNQGGWRYLPRQEADGDLLIRENEHTMLTDEGRRIWRLPAVELL